MRLSTPLISLCVAAPVASRAAGCGSWALARGTVQLGGHWLDGILQLEP